MRFFGARLKIAISASFILVALTLIVRHYGLESIASAAGELSPTHLFVAAVALVLNAFMASFRFRVIAADTGHDVSFRQAMAAVGAGSIGGAMFFQLAGQLMARSVVLSRSGVSASSVVVITGYERIVAALTSGLLAVGGAYVLFGRLAFDADAGFDEFAKIMVGLALAALAGAVIGYRDLAVRLAPLIARRGFVVALIRSVGLSLLVQAPMMAAYIVLVASLSPQTDLAQVVAATAIVMFAASVPISFGGWGIREMSALFALGAIGVGPGEALVSAILVGIGSLLSMGLIAALGARAALEAKAYDAARPAANPRGGSFDRVLTLGVPLMMATLVPFQLMIPTGNGVVNANLADPLALLAGAWLILVSVRSRRPPQWSMRGVNVALVAMTAALGLSLLIGAASFGWTEWATTNRFFGWFVLLGFLSGGALAARELGAEGMRMVGLTYVGALSAVAALELFLMSLHWGGIGLSAAVLPLPVEGFAQNRNAFAFQILIGLGIVAACCEKPRLRILLFALLGGALIISGSRGGWGAAIVLLAGAVVMRAMKPSEAVVAALAAIGLVAFASIGADAASAIVVKPLVGAGLASEGAGSWTIAVMPEPSSTRERFDSILGGIRLFVEAPIFGAGLGAFIAAEIAEFGRPLVIHSTPIWLLAELGLVGAAVFMVPTLAAFIVALGKAREGDPAGRLIILALLALGVTGLVHDMLYQRAFWLAFGAALAAQSTSKLRERPTAIPLIIDRIPPSERG